MVLQQWENVTFVPQGDSPDHLYLMLCTVVYKQQPQAASSAGSVIPDDESVSGPGWKAVLKHQIYKVTPKKEQSKALELETIVDILEKKGFAYAQDLGAALYSKVPQATANSICL